MGLKLTLNFNSLVEETRKLKAKGLDIKSIADELNIKPETVSWLLMNEEEKKKNPPPKDYRVDWSCLGLSTRRLSLIGWALADLAKECVSRGDFEDFEVVVGLETQGSPLALVVADELGKSFATLKVEREKEKTLCFTSLNFSKVEEAKALLVTDVTDSSNETLVEAVKLFKKNKTKLVGLVSIVNKGKAEIEGVKVWALITITPIG